MRTLRPISKKHVIQAIVVIALATTGFQTASATPVSEFSSGWTQFADDDGIIGPGGGGQDFDAEYLFYKLEGNTLSIGLQAGFDLVSGKVVYNNKSYYAGDLALSFDDNTTNGYEFAFDFGLYTENYTVGNTVGGNTGTPGLDHSGIYENVAWDLGVYSGHTSSNPFAMDTGALAYGTTTNGTTAAGQDGDSYWRTVSFDFSELGIGEFIDLDAHWTMSCGNDVIEGHAAPVPEPATMLLFGTGLAGIAGVYRRKKK